MEKNNKDDHGVFLRCGLFRLNLRLPLVQELNRRNIDYCLKDLDEHAMELYVPSYAFTEASEILNEIKSKFKRIRI